MFSLVTRSQGLSDGGGKQRVKVEGSVGRQVGSLSQQLCGVMMSKQCTKSRTLPVVGELRELMETELINVQGKAWQVNVHGRFQCTCQ